MRRLEMSAAFAAVLKKYRKAKRLSQEALAEKADLHPTYIGLMERSLRNPSLNVAQSLADALGVSLSELVRQIRHRSDRDVQRARHVEGG